MNTSPTIKADRRAQSSEVSDEFFKRLEEHILQEDTRLTENKERMDAIEKDLQPLNKMYYAIVGSASIGALLLGLLAYIYTTGQGDFKDLQRAIITQGEAITRLMVSQANLEQSYRRDMDRIEKGQERLYNQSDRQDSRK